MTDVTQFAASTTLSYDYELSNAAPASGIANQATGLATITFNFIDKNSNNNSVYLQKLAAGDTITIGTTTWTITSTTPGTGVITFGLNPANVSTTVGVTNIKFTIVTAGTRSVFPTFTPIIPPPLITNPPPPAFPPPSAVPVGPLVGPAIAAAAVPPSIAGQPLISYRTGSATVPAANGYFTKFTTTPYTGFPNQPPNGVPIVFSNTNNFAAAAPGQTPPFTWPAPPSTATTAQITINGYAPVWTGMAVQEAQEAGGVGAIHLRDAGPPQRRRRAVLRRPDAHP